MKTDSYLEELGLTKLGAKQSFLAYLKIAFLFPILIVWKTLKFLFNPKKSVIRVVKMSIIIPVLEFVTGKSTSDKILADYTYFHNAIIKKTIFDNENLKINFEAHKDILLNSKIATFVTMLILLFVYEAFFEAIDALGGILFASTLLSFGATSFLTAPLGWFLIVAKVLLTIALFAVEINLIRSLFFTTKDEIKDYLDETIFYADIKNEEIFGKEHADKVRQTLYDAYLTTKDEIKTADVKLLEDYIHTDASQITHKKGNEDENSGIK